MADVGWRGKKITNGPLQGLLMIHFFFLKRKGDGGEKKEKKKSQVSYQVLFFIVISFSDFEFKILFFF